MRFRANMCLSGSVDTDAYKGIKCPSTPSHFGVVQAKRAKYSNFGIIKTTATIPNKFCTVIKTYKTTLCWWSQHVPYRSKMADNGHVEKKH